MDVRWIPNRAGQRRLTSDPSGPLGRWLTRVGNQAANSARRRAPVDTGLMRSRIEFRIEIGREGLIGILAARTRYAYFVHQGAHGRAGRPFLLDAVRETIGR